MTDITATTEEYTTDWRVTREVEAKDLHCDHCDHCGKPADSIHFVPWVVDCKKVLFVCPDHDPIPEGYWVEVARWFGEPRADWYEHIGNKQAGPDHDWKRDGGYALALLADRFFDIQRQLAATGHTIHGDNC